MPTKRNNLTHLNIDVERIVVALDLDVVLIGKELVGLCPFHQERGNPNLEVNSETGLWHCWVCGHAGNLPQLIMDLRTVTYREAVHFLEEHSDIPTAQEIKERNLKELDTILRPLTRTRLPSISIAKYLHGRQWWSHVRGYDSETILKFSLGYDSASRRAVIPISYRGYWVSIIRRATSDRQQPRYLFEKDFPRGQLLFGWDMVPKHHNRIILVEGSTDCIRGHSFGFDNVMAILGTSLTYQQMELITENFDEVVLFMDNDPAGHVAALRNAEMLAFGMAKVLVAMYDEILKKDPDELSFSEWIQVLDEPAHWSTLYAG